MVGSYPVPDWLVALPSEQALVDATRVVIHTQEQAGNDLVCDGWSKLIDFLNALHVDHIVMETARRPPEEISVFRDLRPEIGLGLGVIDIKSTEVETAVARGIERAEAVLGRGRIKYVHPDCGFWMLKRSIADAKMRALVAGRDLHAGRPRLAA